MKYWIVKLSYFLLFSFAAISAPAPDIYTFDTPQQQQQFLLITQQLRCLVCQNQNLAESNAPLASDLRTKISIMIKQGQSPTTITQYFVTRYGNFIRYQPPFKTTTYLLWFLPLILLIIGLTMIGKFITLPWQRK